MLKKLLLFSFLTLGFLGFSQNSDIDDLIDQYIDYYELAPETVFVQLNKNEFFLREHLWFKAYVYDTKTQKPYLKTTNLYATVFDRRGNLMEQKLFHVKDAMTNGDFEIKPNYPPGDYLIKFSTNWMKNFNEDHAVYQSFTILGEETDTAGASETKNIKDIQFFPEGGHFVSDIMNTVGFKLNDHKGNPIKILSAKLLNSKGAVITQFSSNDLGMGKLQLKPKATETYSVEAELQDGSHITQAFLKPELKGIAVTVNNLNDQQLYLGVSTNKMTLPSLTGRNFYILIHRDGSLKKVDFEFQYNVYEYTVPVSRDMLFSGVNIVTLFNDKNQPVLERLIFNKNENLRQSLELTYMNKGVDSTKIIFKSNKPFEATISVSALPVGNQSYDTDNNILNSFLLKPYVKGNIDDANYYFEKEDRKTAYDLDILLLVQGWSKHDWKDIFYSPQQALHNFETGFQIAGKLNDAQRKDLKEIQLFSKKDGLMETSKIDNEGYFRFEELRLSDSTEISFTAKNAKGKMVNPKLYYNIYPKTYRDSISKEEVTQLIKSQIVTSSSIDYSGFVSDPFEMANMVSLDTVSIKNKKEQVKNKIIYGKVNGRYIDVKNSFNSFTRILDVISYNGFNVSEDPLSGEVSIMSRRSRQLPSSGTDYSLLIPAVYINNVELINLNELQYMLLNTVEDLYISQSASIAGASDRMGGTINIFLKQNLYAKNVGSSNFNSSQINLGFNKTKAYYTPNYDTSKPELLSQFAAVDWIPTIKADSNGQFQFKIPNYNYGDVKLYISGMAKNGSLISETKILGKNNAAN